MDSFTSALWYYGYWLRWKIPDFQMAESVPARNVLSLKQFERIYGIFLWILFKAIWNNIRDNLCLVFEVVWKNLVVLSSCFWSNLKESREPLASGFCNSFKESRGSFLLWFWSNLKESQGPLLLDFWSMLYERILETPSIW